MYFHFTRLSLSFHQVVATVHTVTLILTPCFIRRQVSRQTLPALEPPTSSMLNAPMTMLEKRVAELKEAPVDEVQVRILMLFYRLSLSWRAP